MLPDLNHTTIAVIGLGYVGLPLAMGLAQKYNVLGFDIDTKRVDELRHGVDRNKEYTAQEIAAPKIKYSSNMDDFKPCQIFIICVPTPVTPANKPDLNPLQKACAMIGGYLKPGDIVVSESTVYPGVTEDFCVPVLESASNLKCGEDFFIGYSPERINPGDRVHTIQRVYKVVAGQTPAVRDLLVAMYGTLNNDQIHAATSIKVAEMAKAIENAQRDINIAYMNEIALICMRLGISVYDVLEAARTKWNFLGFSPGLVGGHCIGVDPYYLADCAQKQGLMPEVVLAGRRVNDTMGQLLADRFATMIKENRQYGQPIKVLILGFTFKEDVADTRNTKVIDIVRRLRTYSYEVDVHDPNAYPSEVEHEYGIPILNELPKKSQYQAIITAVAHKEYSQLGADKICELLMPGGWMIDIKGLWRKTKLPNDVKYYVI